MFALKMQKSPPPVAPKPQRHLNKTALSLQSVSTESAVSPKPVALSSNDAASQLDKLTNALVYNLNQATSEPDFYGMCSRCSGTIKGSDGGCTAMDKFYHISCFTCQHCGRSLSGHSFYAVKDESVCEGCYVNTLERCTVCMKPVTKRILRATGKPYHPECFVCSHCTKSLDGLPFTVDSHNQVHCIPDFHMKYAPRCCVCREAIIPEDGSETVRVVALEKNFHLSCYKCMECGSSLSADQSISNCFPVDDKIFCKLCYQKQSLRINPEPQALSLSDDL